MILIAPSDKGNKGSLSWLLRQLHKPSEEDVHIGFHWPGSKRKTLYTLNELKENPKIAFEDNQFKVIKFEVSIIRNLARRFGQPTNFIKELEKLVLDFYKNVGQHLCAYQPPAPKIQKDKTDSESVTPEGLQRIVTEETLE